MADVVVSSGSSKAEVSLTGAHVGSLSLDGEAVLKPSTDGSQTHGGAAVLIPFPGRVRGGVYSFEGSRYAIPVGEDGNARHGFAKDLQWELSEKSTDSARLKTVLAGSGYPVTLEVELKYSLTVSSFSTSCTVRNSGERDCPLAIGFHPYFLAKDWRITTGKAYRYELADGYFPTGRREEYSFGDAGRARGSLDDVFAVDGQVSLEDAERSLHITRKNMPYLVVYDGKYADGVSVAVEPYTAVPDAFNNGIGLVALHPGQSFACGYSVESAH